MRWVALVVFIVGCYKEHTFRDCELSCTNEVGCPSGLSCLDGMCRESGQTGTCAMHTGDGMVDSPADTTASVDTDNDTIPDDVDNCPNMRNPDQNDEDRDSLGDVCDVCPISPNNTDTDHDGVGDDCDPDNTVTNRIVLFEGFKTAPTNGAPSGGGQWTFANGTATGDSGFNTAYLWQGTGVAGQAKIYTSVTINSNNGTPYFAGTVMGADTTTQGGAACANYATASGGTFFTIVEVATNASQNPAPGSTFSPGQNYPITEQQLNNTYKCNRGAQFQTTGAPPSGTGPMWGLIVSSANATFDYVMVVAQ